MTNGGVIYQGRDLEAMSFAVNYHRWILQLFAPYLGKRVVEVGAGTGSFSELILEYPLDSLSLIEPSESMFAILREQIRRLNTPTEITTYNAIFRRVADQLKFEQRPDSIVYVNVMEHIEDDVAELQAVNEILPPGGKLLVFVPALNWLYSEFDKSIGHFRRYTKTELENKCVRGNFRVIKSLYFDSIGIAPWLLKYKFLGSLKMEPQAVHAYDKYVVPIVRMMESTIAPPIGKNILLVAEKIADQ